MRRPANKTKRQRGAETAVKVLLYDVETSPNLAYIWGKYEQNALGDFVEERQIISFSWKWLGKKGVHVIALPIFSLYKLEPKNNRALMRRLHSLFSKADIVIGHNVDQFDDKMSNTDFVKHGFSPPPPHKTVDTLKVARSKFRFNSNKLGDLGAFLKLGRKVKHSGFELWLRCLRGDRRAWATMKRYNKGDVILLEKIYYRLRPWMTNHPSMIALDRHTGCPMCRSTRLQRRGWGIVGGNRRQRFRCSDCTKWSTGIYVHHEWRFR